MTIEEKIAEIEEYKRVLERYRQRKGQGRWYNAGCRHLEELKSQLQEMKDCKLLICK